MFSACLSCLSSPSEGALLVLWVQPLGDPLKRVRGLTPRNSVPECGLGNRMLETSEPMWCAGQKSTVCLENTNVVNSDHCPNRAPSSYMT